MRSIGTLGLHNKVAFFEKLGPLRTLKIHSQYLYSKVLQFISPQIFLGITKASYGSITMNLIDLESQMRSLQSHVDVLRVEMKRSTKSVFANGKQAFPTILILSQLETI